VKVGLGDAGRTDRKPGDLLAPEIEARVGSAKPFHNNGPIS